MALYRAVCDSLDHNPPGRWVYPPEGTTREAAENLVRMHVVADYAGPENVGHAGARVEEYTPPAQPQPQPTPAAPGDPAVQGQLGGQQQYDFHDKNWTTQFLISLVLNDVPWPVIKTAILQLFDQVGVQVQIDNTGRVQVAATVDVVKLNLDKIHKGLEAHVQAQAGGLSSGGGHDPSGVASGGGMLSQKIFKHAEIQVGGQVQCADGHCNGQVTGGVVLTWP
jgi:hypothetical protein